MTPDAFFARMHEHGPCMALAAPDCVLSYDARSDAITEWRARLRGDGIAGGDSIAFNAAFTPASVSFFLALVAERCVAVPLCFPSEMATTGCAEWPVSRRNTGSRKPAPRTSGGGRAGIIRSCNRCAFEASRVWSCSPLVRPELRRRFSSASPGCCRATHRRAHLCGRSHFSTSTTSGV